MSLRIRRGTEAQRSGITFDIGEIVWTTNGQKLYVGDGLTQGGIDVAAQLAGENLVYNETTGKIDFAGASYTTDDIAPGSNLARQYFSTESAQDAAAAMLTAGVHTNITFTYTTTQDGANRIDAAVTPDGVGISQVYDDTSPSLGGNLELNSFDISGTGNIDITGDITFTGALLNEGGVTLGSLEVVTSLTSPTILSSTAYTGGLIESGFVSDNVLKVGSNATPITSWSYSATSFNIQTGINDGLGSSSSNVTRISRGTLASKTAVQPGDALSPFLGYGYDGTGFVLAGSFGIAADPAGSISSGVVPGAFGVTTFNSTGSNLMVFDSQGTLSAPRFLAADGDATDPSIAFSTDGGVDTGFFHPGDGVIGITTNAVEIARFDSGGFRTTGFSKVGSYATGSEPTPAEEGMIIFDSTSKKFMGYAGVTKGWVELSTA